MRLSTPGRDTTTGRRRRRWPAVLLLLVLLLALVPALLFVAPWKPGGVRRADGSTGVWGGTWTDQWEWSGYELNRVLFRLRVALFEAPWEDRAEWQEVARATIARVEAASALVDGRWYQFGGYVSGKPYTQSARVEYYDPVADSWTRVAEMPHATNHVQAATDGRYIWIAGGFVGSYDGPAVRRVLRYDTATDRWSDEVPLPSPRAGGVLVWFDGSLHYIGGYGPGRDDNPTDHWVYDPHGDRVWRSLASLPEGRGHLSGVVLGNRIYVIGGQIRHDTDPETLASLQMWDPATDRWTRLADMPFPRSHFEGATVVHDGGILILGGVARASALGARPFPSMYRYDAADDSWRELPGLPVGLMGPQAAIIGDRLYVTGGNDIFESGAGQRATVWTALD